VKQCISCELEKPFEEFYKRKDSPDGYRNDCKACRKAVSVRTYYQDVEGQKESRRAYYRKRMLADPNYHTKKYWADVELTRAQGREYYQKNRERLLKKVSEYARKNVARANAIKKKYKLAKQRSCPAWVLSSQELCKQIRGFYEEAKTRTDLSGVVHHVDHIVPLQGENVCGLHVPWNLQVLTASENCSKQNKLIEESV
jgi:phage gp46-like protein